MFGMGTGVTLLLWPPGNLVSGILIGGRGNMCAAARADEVVPEHFNKLLNNLQSIACLTTHSQSSEVNKWSSLTAD